MGREDVSIAPDTTNMNLIFPCKYVSPGGLYLDRGPEEGQLYLGMWHEDTELRICLSQEHADSLSELLKSNCSGFIHVAAPVRFLKINTST